MGTTRWGDSAANPSEGWLFSTGLPDLAEWPGVLSGDTGSGSDCQHIGNDHEPTAVEILRPTMSRLHRPHQYQYRRSQIFPHANGVVATPRPVGTKVGRTQVAIPRSKPGKQRMLRHPHFESLSQVNAAAPASPRRWRRRPGVKGLRKILAKQKLGSPNRKNLRNWPGQRDAIPHIRRSCSARRHCRDR